MSRFNNRSSYNDLLLFGVNHYFLTVNDELHELYGIVCSDSESEDDNLLESYLTQTKTVRSPSQSMARTKQTARKTTSDGRLPMTPVTTTRNNKSTPNPALQSPGGQNLVTFP